MHDGMVFWREKNEFFFDVECAIRLIGKRVHGGYASVPDYLTGCVETEVSPCLTGDEIIEDLDNRQDFGELPDEDRWSNYISPEHRAKLNDFMAEWCKGVTAPVWKPDKSIQIPVRSEIEAEVAARSTGVK